MRRKQIERVARPDDRRIDPGGTPEERNPADFRRNDLEQDTEAEAYTSESLTTWLRQVNNVGEKGKRKGVVMSHSDQV